MQPVFYCLVRYATVPVSSGRELFSNPARSFSSARAPIQIQAPGYFPSDPVPMPSHRACASSTPLSTLPFHKAVPALPLLLVEEAGYEHDKHNLSTLRRLLLQK